MESVIGGVLRVGVLVSVLLLGVALVWQWLAAGTLAFGDSLRSATLYRLLLGDARDLAHGALRPRLLVSLGIAVLLVTPYLRVAASVAYFAFVERDAKYTVFTSFVLALLTYSLFAH